MLQNLKANAYYYTLLLFSFSLPFPILITNILIILLVIGWFSVGSITQKISLLKEHKISLLLMSVFFLYCLGLLYSDNLAWGLFKIEKILTLLLFPLIILSSPRLSDKQFGNVLKAFVGGVLLASIMGITYAIYKRFFLKNLTEFELNNFYIEIPHLFMSHVYFGIYMVLAIYILVYLFLKRKTNSFFHKLSTGVLTVFLYVLVFTSGSFMSFIALVLSTIILLCYYLYNHFKITYIIIALLGVVVALGVLIESGHPSLNRYKQRIFLSFDNVENDQYNYSSNRVGPLVAGFSVAKEHWLWGVGTSDTEKFMEASYRNHGLDQLVHLNTHNQYLDFLITFGIVGFTLYLVTLLYPFYISIKYKFYLYTFFLILILISGITENILASNKGILLYALFNSIFAYQFFYGKNSSANNI